MKRGSIICVCLILGASSAFAQTNIHFTGVQALPSNQVEIMWSSDTNRWYAIERTADLTNWTYEFDFVIPDDSAPIASNHWALTTGGNPCFFRLFAGAPVAPQDNVYTNMGTPSNDTQIVTGTINRDYVVQYGEGGSDIQYVSAGGEADWIAQYGNSGKDTQTVRGGTADDWIYQDGGDENDTLGAQADDGDDRVIQKGGIGNDNMNATCGWGSDRIQQYGGPGHDHIKVDGGDGDDYVRMLGGEGDDHLGYDITFGFDAVLVNGGSDSDTLTVNEQGVANQVIRLLDGTEIYKNGLPDTVITVVDVEQIHVVDAFGVTNWSWSAP